jgi:hypothetical protein
MVSYGLLHSTHCVLGRASQRFGCAAGLTGTRHIVRENPTATCVSRQPCFVAAFTIGCYEHPSLLIRCACPRPCSSFTGPPHAHLHRHDRIHSPARCGYLCTCQTSSISHCLSRPCRVASTQHRLTPASATWESPHRALTADAQSVGPPFESPHVTHTA